ncbi:hypothetical protein BCh11DRAFT_07568 [Burkholderia sp. Ch1-1]|nr:hypothetical protein BCh11DRAFT_07568 [Burkholderia sp. Ch1-1]
MDIVISTAALVIALVALCVTVASRQTRQHFYAYSQCCRVIGPDGQERDQWSFSSSRANTLIANTVGRLYIAVAEARFRRRQHNQAANK